MTASVRAKLYSPELLALAVELARYPYDDGAPLHGAAHSRTCGSSVALSCRSDPCAGVADLGLRVSACAVGQAAAAIFAGAADGCEFEDLVEAEKSLAKWLTGGPLPSWPRIEALNAACDYPARHGAILLPWKAATDALSKSQDAR